MNNEEPYRDQAERLKQRIQKINDNVVTSDSGEESGSLVESGKVVKSDELPPRELIHRQKKQKTNWKLKYPVIRLLAMCFILLPIIIFSVIAYRDSVKKINETEMTSGNSAGYETITIEETNTEVENNPTNEEETKETTPDNSGLGDSTEVKETPVEVIEPETTSPIVSTQTPGTNEDTKKQEPDSNKQEQKEVTKSPTNTTSQPDKIIYHKVQPQETLYKLATKYYHSKTGIEIIRKANGLPNEQINIGQVLKIPLNN